MSRYDYIYIDIDLFNNLTESELKDIYELEFQTKDLDREFLEYRVGKDRRLTFIDYHYELVDSDGFFSQQMVRVEDGMKDSNHTGVVMFYGKPYEKMYTFQAKFTNGKLMYIRVLSII